MNDTSKPVKRVAKKVPAKKVASAKERVQALTAPPKPFLREGVWYEPVWMHRFLMADGTVIDVKGVSDDSRLREAILDSRKPLKIDNDRIAGSTRVEFLGYSDLSRLIDTTTGEIKATG